MAYENQAEPTEELATRMGALAMLIYSVIATLAGALLPHLSRRDKRLLADPNEDEEMEIERLTGLIYLWRKEAASKGKKMKLPVMPLLLRTVWMGALLLFSIITFSTFFVTTVNGVRYVYDCLETELTCRLGYLPRQLGWCLLGGGLLGTVCDYHGGMYAHFCHQLIF